MAPSSPRRPQAPPCEGRDDRTTRAPGAQHSTSTRLIDARVLTATCIVRPLENAASHVVVRTTNTTHDNLSANGTAGYMLTTTRPRRHFVAPRPKKIAP